MRPSTGRNCLLWNRLDWNSEKVKAIWDLEREKSGGLTGKWRFVFFFSSSLSLSFWLNFSPCLSGGFGLISLCQAISTFYLKSQFKSLALQELIISY